MIRETKSDVSSSYGNEEHILMQAINAYNETEKAYNLVFERLGEWYGIYYPEIKMTNPATLSELAVVLNNREGIDKEEIDKIIQDPQKSEMIYEKAKKSMGRQMTDEENVALMEFVELSRRMNKTLTGLDSYIKSAATRIMPNTTYLTDHKIAAELLAKAGSLERLATMPAGTVQLLGAEKALFKHIKFGSKPPKYGIIFKLPDVTNGQREKRGRIARVYATKICIALKADYFSKNFIAEKLKASLDESLKTIGEKVIAPRPERHYDDRRPQQGGGGGNWQKRRPQSGRGGGKSGGHGNNYRRRGRKF